MRLIIVGHARHGKDTVGGLFTKLGGYNWASSSYVAADKVVRPYLKKFYSIEYDTVDECFIDRINHRAAWYDAITAYNTPDKTKLAQDIFAENDIYVGLRNKKELWAIKTAGIVDHVIWVDALDRLPPEPASSMSIEPWMADYHIDNNGTIEETEFNVMRLLERFHKESVKEFVSNLLG
tara:strand:- start:5905 stop:6441 length:537 start_codon:yes stop_codon:yes gene_type:complete